MQRNSIAARESQPIALSALLRAMWHWARGCAARRRQRHFLALLDERGMRDIGLTRSDVMREVEKPFWRA